MKERNQSIDAIRFLAAILVVCLHVSLPKGQIWSMNILFLARSAVPLFFMISGYLFGVRQKWDHQIENYMKKQIWKITKIAVLSYLLYILIDIWRTGPKMVFHILLNYKTVIRFLFFNKTFYGGHLWYLFAYMCVLIVYYILVKKNKVKWMYYWTPIGLILYYVLGKYSKLIFGEAVNFWYARNFLMIGLPCFAIGYYLGQRGIQPAVQRKNIEKAGWLLCLFWQVGLIWAERSFLRDCHAYFGYNNFIFNTSIAVTALVFALRFPGKSKWVCKMADWGRKYSIVIYIFHPLVSRCIGFVVKKIDFWVEWTQVERNLQIWRAILPILCLIGCIMIKFVWDGGRKVILEKKKK